MVTLHVTLILTFDQMISNLFGCVLVMLNLPVEFENCTFKHSSLGIGFYKDSKWTFDKFCLNLRDCIQNFAPKVYI